MAYFVIDNGIFVFADASRERVRLINIYSLHSLLTVFIFDNGIFFMLFK